MSAPLGGELFVPHARFSLTLVGVRKVPLRLVTGGRQVSVKHPSDLESAPHADAGAACCSGPSLGARSPVFCCRSGTDAVFSSCCCCCGPAARYALGDDGVDLATAAGGTRPSRATNRSHIARATGTQWVTTHESESRRLSLRSVTTAAAAPRLPVNPPRSVTTPADTLSSSPNVNKRSPRIIPPVQHEGFWGSNCNAPQRNFFDIWVVSTINFEKCLLLSKCYYVNPHFFFWTRACSAD